MQKVVWIQAKMTFLDIPHYEYSRCHADMSDMTDVLDMFNG